jgi:hypothetical protein
MATKGDIFNSACTEMKDVEFNVKLGQIGDEFQFVYSAEYDEAACSKEIGKMIQGAKQYFVCDN